ncbi:hypothetical protein EST38_g10834 [Candolleomyces aberdarensis]|uniref:Cytochrome P450 n=1 Tax=Candolleomyces aberdarensis TaxID=2316362 RepID=A0A4Q2D8N9_9AGAR|nr:hypothetical protein EST38_g10834 [Candolleomyces aberdarensis]
MKYDDFFGLMRYSPMWRKHRREFHSTFNQAVVNLYHPVILEERINLLRDLLAYPSEYRKHTKRNKELLHHARMIETFPDVDDPRYEEVYNIAQDCSAQVYGAASDTSFSNGIAFFLVLAMYPEVQKRAQKEIDEVMGFGKLPDFNDRPQLVYVEALIMELLRWHQPVPLGVAHATSEDDLYEGYFIPKGTVVMGNIWHILHNPETYPDPFNFNPDRFIKDGKINQEVTDPFEATFGFGRRICPGRYIALDTLYALISSTLAMFDVSVPKDENGNPDIKPSFSIGIMCQPEPFECSITPRSERHEELIQSLYTSLPSNP